MLSKNLLDPPTLRQITLGNRLSRHRMKEADLLETFCLYLNENATQKFQQKAQAIMKNSIFRDVIFTCIPLGYYYSQRFVVIIEVVK